MTASTDPGARPAGVPRARTWRGAVAGLLTGAVALGIGQLVAGITGPQFSPVTAVGGAAIDLTPPPLKNFAIAHFGVHDKTVLIGGVVVVFAVLAAVVGALAVRRLPWGLAGVAFFTAVALAAAITRPTSGVTSVLPALAAAAAAAAALVALVRALPPAAPPAAVGGPPAGSAAPPVPDVPERPQPEPATSERGWIPRNSPPPAPADPGRRSFLVSGSVAAGVAAAGAFGGRLLAERSNVASAQAALRLPHPVRLAPPLPSGYDFHIRGLSPFITPNSTFYRVDTALVLPEVNPANWTLRIHGMVQRELVLTFHDLLRRPMLEDYITLCCVSNPVAGPYIGNAKWLGASIASLLREAGIRHGADQLLCTSVDGYTSGTPIQTVMDGRDALFAVGMNGKPLPVNHGFPVRMVVPGLYGYVSATKWVTDINVTTFAHAQGYWVPRGWSQQAPIKTESRIDVPGLGSAVRAGQVAVAGVAWAQHKGIDAVEVRVDNGPWHQARLAAVPGIDTWRQWAWYWDATPGNHTIESRATDATGYTQTAFQAPPEPNGASGYPVVSVTVR